MYGIYKNDVYSSFVCISHENSIFYFYYNSSYDIDLFGNLLNRICEVKWYACYYVHVLARDFNSPAG